MFDPERAFNYLVGQVLKREPRANIEVVRRLMAQRLLELMEAQDSLSPP